MPQPLSNALAGVPAKCRTYFVGGNSSQVELLVPLAEIRYFVVTWYSTLRASPLTPIFRHPEPDRIYLLLPLLSSNPLILSPTSKLSPSFSLSPARSVGSESRFAPLGNLDELL